MNSCSRVFVLAEGIQYEKIDPVSFGFDNDTFFLLQGELYKIDGDSFVAVTIDGKDKFKKIITANDEFFAITDDAVYVFDVYFNKICLLDLYNLVPKTFYLRNTLMVDKTIYFRFFNMESISDKKQEYYALDTINHTFYSPDYFSIGKYTYSLDGHVFSNYNGMHIYENDEIYTVGAIKYDNDKRELCISNLEGEEKTFPIMTNSNKYLFKTGTVKRFGTKTYFTLSERVFNDGCRISIEEVAKKYGDDYVPCEHSIGETYLYCYDIATNELFLKRKLKSGTFVIDVDEEMNLVTYCDNKVYKNDVIIKELIYEKAITNAEYSIFYGWKYSPNSSDYFCIKNFSYISNTLICFIDFNSRYYML